MVREPGSRGRLGLVVLVLVKRALRSARTVRRYGSEAFLGTLASVECSGVGAVAAGPSERSHSLFAEPRLLAEESAGEYRLGWKTKPFGPEHGSIVDLDGKVAAVDDGRHRPRESSLAHGLLAEPEWIAAVRPVTAAATGSDCCDRVGLAERRKICAHGFAIPEWANDFPRGRNAEPTRADSQGAPRVAPTSVPGLCSI